MTRARRPLLALLSFALALPLAAATPVDATVAAALAAKQAGDWPTMQAKLQEVLVQRPLQPRYSYQLAVARAKQGATDAAIALLEQVASQGMAYQPEADPDLAALASTPRFAAVVAAFARNRAPVGTLRVVATLDDRALVPEGLVCGADGICYISSAHRGSILKLMPDGRARPFVTPRRDGLWSALGLALDPQRGLLWVASAALPELDGLAPEERGRTGVFAFALGDGRLVHRYPLPDDGRPRALGDLRLLGDDRLLVSDQQGGALFTLDARTGAFKRLTALGALISPQGAVIAPDLHSALVADHSLGLMRVDLDTGAVARVPSLPQVCSYGIDGLYAHGDGLIAVQNGLRPQRVVRFELEGGRLVRATVLAANDARLSEPTLGAVVGERFRFISGSQWDRFDADGRLPPDAELGTPQLLELLLPPL